MKLLKNGIRIWITMTSVGGFLAGWALLAHANKPVSAEAANPTPIVEPLPTLAPLPSFNSRTPSRNFQVQPVQPQSNFQPRFRSGGS
jgi:hypothetical protein